MELIYESAKEQEVWTRLGDEKRASEKGFYLAGLLNMAVLCCGVEIEETDRAIAEAKNDAKHFFSDMRKYIEPGCEDE